MSLIIEIAGHSIPFQLWRPGQVLKSSIIGLDSETEAIEDGAVPRLVIATASDGTDGFIISPRDIAAFITAHSGKTFVLHNAAFDLAVFRCAGVDIFPLIESGCWWDTGLLFQLLKLADRGSCHGPWSLDYVSKELLKVDLPKDLRSCDGQDVRTTFGRFLKPDGTLDPVELLKPEHRIYLQYAAADPVATLLIAQALNDWAVWLFSTPFFDIFDPATYAFAGLQDDIDVAAAWSKYGFLTHHIQLKGSVALGAISREGMHIDTSSVASVIEELDAELSEVKTTLNRFGWAPGTGSNKKFNAIMARVEKELDEELPRLTDDANT